MALKRCRHGTFAFNVHDTYVARSLDLYGEWCESEIALLTPLLARGDVVIDVGAHIGTHTLPFAHAVGLNGLVIAIEPQRLAHQTLSGNIALNALMNVRALLTAAGAKAGQTTIAQLDPRVAQNFGGLPTGRGPGEPIGVVAIDSFGLVKCRLIKVDAEGAEPDVIAGARETIARCRPLLFLEANTPDRARAVLEAVEARGYLAYWQMAAYFNPDNFFGVTDNFFGEEADVNVLCTPSESKFVPDLEPAQKTDDFGEVIARLGKRAA